MIWEHLGFSRDIFFVEPLRPTEDDMKLFVGRDEEIKKYLVDTLSGSRALKIVSGEIGVGKTTFVNAGQYFSYIKEVPGDFKFGLPNVLACFEKIQLRESDTIDDFSQQAILSICRSIAIHCKLKQLDLPKEVKEILSFFQDLSFRSGGGGFGVGITVAGTGAQVSKTTETRALNIIRNARVHLQNLIGVAKGKLKFEGVFILVNNMDILSKDKLIDFFNTSRDELFDIQGIYWTFIGNKGIGGIIETEVERVRHYLSGTELYIAPLGLDKTKEVIRTRVEHFGVKPDAKCPLTEQTIGTIHRLSLQETRETLKICGEIVTRVIMVDPSHDVIPHNVAMNAFIQYAHERAEDIDFTPSQIKLLEAVYDKKSCRPKEHKRFGYETAPGFIAALKGLVKKRLLSIDERPRATIYKMTGMTVIAALTGALGPQIQKAASRNLTEGVIPKEDSFNSAQLALNLDD